jgi:diguanylate cyclase
LWSNTEAFSLRRLPAARTSPINRPPARPFACLPMSDSSKMPLPLRWLSRKLLALGFGRSVAVSGAMLLLAEFGLFRLAAVPGGVAVASPLRLVLLASAALVPLVIVAVLARMLFGLESARRRLAVAATQDDLTGTYNRRHFMDVAQREWARCRRYGDDVALLLIDADHFKPISGEYGSAAGAAVLIDIAQAAAQTLRQTDLLARFGSEELIVLLPHTDPLGALDVAERIRERVASRPLRWDHEELQTTVSIGVASIGADHGSLDLVVRDAAEALAAAQQAGRNCVRAAPIQPRRSGSTYPVISR